MFRTVWDTPSASSRKKLQCLRLGTGVEYVAWNCMGRTVRQFEKEASLRLGTGVEYVVWNCMGRAVRQKLVLDQQQEKYFLTDTLKKACDRLALQKNGHSRLCLVSRPKSKLCVH